MGAILLLVILATQMAYGFILRQDFVSIVLLAVVPVPLMWLVHSVLIRVITFKLMGEVVLLTVQLRLIRKRLPRRDVCLVPRTAMPVILQVVPSARQTS